MTNSGASPIAAVYALLLLVGLPVLAAIDARRGVELEEAATHRRALYASVAVSLLVIAGATLGVSAWQRVPIAEVGWRVEDPGRSLAWGLGATAVGLPLIWAITTAARAVGLTESPVAKLLMPRDAGETRAFLVLSGAAAVCEEYIFRGFLLWALTGWTGSVWFAAGVVSLSFGLAHGYQKLAGILRAALLGILLAVPTILTGSLFPAIVAHFWINAAVGLGGWRLLLPDTDAG
jgi:membrane protease YdiL (CAAX protease family)